MAKVPLALNHLEVLANQQPAHLASQHRPLICLVANHPNQHLVHLVQQHNQPQPGVFSVQPPNLGACLALQLRHLPPIRLGQELLANRLEPLERLQLSSLLPLAGLEQQLQHSLEVFLAQVLAQLLLQQGDFLEALLSPQLSLVGLQVPLVPQHQLPLVLVEVFLPLASRINLALVMSSSILSMAATP